LLSTKFYANIILLQLEYGSATNNLSAAQLKILEDAQDQYLQKIYGGHSRSSTKVILHLAKLPPLKDHPHILQAEFQEE
jgi:hypothetical protein